jgi:hypothetical protein
MVMRIGYAPAKPWILDILLCVLMVSNVSASEQRSLLLLGIDLHAEEKPSSSCSELSNLIFLWV